MLWEYARAAADRIESLEDKERVLVVTHHDADGITAGAIASCALGRKKLLHDVKILPQLEDKAIAEILASAEDFGLVWFTDIGSGALSQIKDLKAVITDHHDLDPRFLEERNMEPNPGEMGLDQWADIYSKALEEVSDKITMVNPHVIGESGDDYISGAGTTYLVAKLLDKENIELSALAVVGAVGDMQDKSQGRLGGMNRDIIQDAEEAEVIKASLDLRLYGRMTRPVYSLLAYSREPKIADLYKDRDRIIRIMRSVGIEPKGEGGWKRWYQLEKEEKRALVSVLTGHMITWGMEVEQIKALVGEVYTLVKEEPGTELSDAKEFSTLINSCGRYGYGMVAVNVCLGNRDEWLAKARGLLSDHKSLLQEKLAWLRDNDLVEESKHIQYFHAKFAIPDTITGTVAGMLLGSGKVREDIPIFGMAYTEDQSAVKVSARATESQVMIGLDLSKVMSFAAESVGGTGGGHKISAGAAIPKGKEQEFLGLAEAMVKSMLLGEDMVEFEPVDDEEAGGEGEEGEEDEDQWGDEEEDVWNEEDERVYDEMLHWRDDELGWE